MALVITSWDLPAQDKLEEYGQKAATSWIPTIMQQPGVKEFRAYRTAYGASPQVMVHTEFATLAAAQAWISSEACANQIAELRATGCPNVTFEIWDASPIVPDPIKAAA